jgi:hypothetical protein
MKLIHLLLLLPIMPIAQEYYSIEYFDTNRKNIILKKDQKQHYKHEITKSRTFELLKKEKQRKLYNDLKKFIKENDKKLQHLDEQENWNGIYTLLCKEFNVKLNSYESVELLKEFSYVFR